MNPWIEEKIEELEERIEELDGEYNLHNTPPEIEMKTDALWEEIILWRDCPKLKADVFPARTECPDSSRYLYVYKPQVSPRAADGCKKTQAELQKILDKFTHYVPCITADRNQKMLSLLPKGHFFKI